MNETLIKEIIKCKLDVASTITEHMPSSVSEEIRNVGRIILEGLNENFQESGKVVRDKVNNKSKLNNIPVE